ncbi:MAG: hypothetical protein KGL37_07055 [Acidobacteriota bacterium]|nr:hypothetical protein [Acidobacteriota bacterium]
MSFDRILCLANSYKHDHRCVAGINLVTRRWVRLIGQKIPGCLTVRETCYADGREATILDVVELELGETCGSCCHPEDVLVTAQPWRLVRRFEEPADAHFLDAFLNKSPAVLHGSGDRIYARKFASAPADKSLELVHPNDLWWWIRDESGKRKYRALFRLGHVNRTRYDLAVTDPVWLAQLQLLPAGIYPHAFFCKEKPAKTFLTVSLSEVFDSFHYKLVAGVVSFRS